MTTARATATRCAWPCDSSAGRACAAVGEPQRPEHLARARAILRQPGEVLREHQVVLDAEAGDEMQLLRHEPDVPAAKAVELRARRAR